MTSTPAHAGAWIAPEGGQNIATELAGERNEALYFESAYYIESPLNEDISYVHTSWLSQQPNQAMLDDWRWELSLAGKLATRRGERSVTALQAGVVWNSNPAAHCAEGQAEVRWLGGRSIGERSFANIEVAERAGDEGCGGERLDLTFGHRFEQRWLGIGEIFVDQPRVGEGTVKAQISLVRFSEEGRGLQIGLRARLDGEAAEPAIVLGFWGKADDRQ